MKFKLSLLLVMFLTTISFSADACCCGKSHGVYLGGMAGVDLQIFDISSARVRTYPGGAVAGALGYKFQNGFRLEGEYSYRRNTIRKITDKGLGNLHGGGYAETQAYLVNLLFDIDLCKDWTPYLGVGYGHARLTSCVKTASNGNFKKHSEGAASQYIGGVMHRIMYNTDLGAEFRYFRSRQHAQDYTLALTMRRFF